MRPHSSSAVGPPYDPAGVQLVTGRRHASDSGRNSGSNPSSVVSRSVSQSVGQSVNRSVSQSVSQSVGWLMSRDSSLPPTTTGHQGPEPRGRAFVERGRRCAACSVRCLLSSNSLAGTPSRQHVRDAVTPCRRVPSGSSVAHVHAHPHPAPSPITLPQPHSGLQVCLPYATMPLCYYATMLVM